MHIRSWLIPCLLLLLAIPLDGQAQIYKYRDENGRLNFVDDESKVPARYRKEMKSLQESQDSLGSYESPDRAEPPPVVAPAPPAPEPSYKKKRLKKYATPIVIRKNRILLPVEAAAGSRSAKLTLLLDTGATSTVFYRQSLSELSLPKGKPHKARVAGGGIVKSERIRFKHIKVGPFTVDKKTALVINLEGRSLPYDGMLGMDFLKNHPYQIDYEKNVINWEPVN